MSRTIIEQVQTEGFRVVVRDTLTNETYFMRRALDLLVPGGIGVFLVPAGFLSGSVRSSFFGTTCSAPIACRPLA